MLKYQKYQKDPFKPKVRWYVFANRTDALIYKEENDQRFFLLEHLSNQSGKLHEGGLDSDGPGTGFSSAGGGTIHHSLDHHFSQHEQVAIRFARRIARKLAVARQQNRYDEIVLVAEPRFLGILKEALTPSIKKQVVREVIKEYSARLNPSELQESLHQAIK